MNATWSWSIALQDGSLSEVQFETLQSLIEDGQAESLAGAARYMDDRIAEEADASGDPRLREL